MKLDDIKVRGATTSSGNKMKLCAFNLGERMFEPLPSILDDGFNTVTIGHQMAVPDRLFVTVIADGRA